ncbi:MAG: DUF3048 domain-containing protein [Chloroflexi bacterium]|nr:DUF3048 domain-containing protein [Chloroflexota bacterium]
MRPTSHRSGLVSACFLLTLAACASPVVETATATLPAPSVEVIQFTATPPPSPLPTFVPPTPDPSATPGPTPTVLPTPHWQTGPEDYPPDVNPLTGLRVADPASLDKRPLAVKISNYPPCVRPQSGLSAAELVFEHYAEGGTTRFTAIFYGQNPGAVGSVRSARFIDLELPAMYQSLLAFSGVSDGLLPKFRQADFRSNILSPEFGAGCRPFCRRPVEETPCGRSGTPLLEHSLFSNTRDLWAYADSLAANQKPELTGMVFDPQPPPGGAPGERLTVSYVASFAQWLWPAILFRDGQAYQATWTRFGRNAELSIVFDGDNYVPFKPGNTWFEIVPHDSEQLQDGAGWTVKPTRQPNTPFGK